MLTEIKENNPSLQSRYLGEFLIAHELGHALLGLPDYVSTPNTQEFGARGIASEYKLNYFPNASRTQTKAEAWLHGKLFRERPL
jgi:Zn-dependent peptidase ImmA (M78 family)